MTLKFWRLLSMLSIAACLSLAAVVGWVALAFWSNLKQINSGMPVCLPGARTYDSVAAAQMIGRLDLVSFLLTAGGLLLAVFALMGFWMIRREALDEASRVAADEARKVAQIYYSLDQNAEGTYIGYRGAGASPSDYDTLDKRAETLKRDVQAPSFDPDTVSVAGATEEGKGAVNAKSARRSRGRPRAPKPGSDPDGADR